MHLKSKKYILLLILSVLLTASCSNTKFLSGDQLLYTGKNKVKVISPENNKNQKVGKPGNPDCYFL